MQKEFHKIKPASDNLPELDFSAKPDDYLFVSGIQDVLADNNQESLVLNLCSRVAITNETTRVTKKYPTTQNITATVEQIVKDVLQAKLASPPDQTENKYGFIGNMRKPFTVLRWLSSKAVPDLKGDGVAGFYSSKQKKDCTQIC